MYRLWELLLSFLQVGLFSIGGGYATLPLIQQHIVEKMGWLSMREFADIVTISQMTPGPLAVNTSTFVGARVAGLSGAVIATFGCVITGVLISQSLHRFFGKNRDSDTAMAVLDSLRSASVGLIAGAGASLLLLSLFGTVSPSLPFSSFNIVALGIFVASFAVLRKYRLNPVLLMLLAGVAGIVAYA